MNARSELELGRALALLATAAGLGLVVLGARLGGEPRVSGALALPAGEPVVPSAWPAEGARSAPSFASPDPLADGASTRTVSAAARGPSADGEAEHEARWRSALGAPGADPAELRARARATLLGPAARSEKVAVLRALHAERTPGWPELFALALRELPLESDPHGESVPEFVLTHLGRCGAKEPEARIALLEALRAARGRELGALRGRGLVRCIELAEPRELDVLAAEVALESDPLVRDMVASALADRERGSIDERALSEREVEPSATGHPRARDARSVHRPKLGESAGFHR